MTRFLEFPHDDDRTPLAKYSWLWVEAEVRLMDTSFDAYDRSGVLSTVSDNALAIEAISIQYTDEHGNMVPLPKAYIAQNPKLIAEIESEVLSRAEKLNWEAQ